MKKISLLGFLFLCLSGYSQISTGLSKKLFQTTITNNSNKGVTSSSIYNALLLKANLSSPTFIGDPKAPTPPLGDNDTSVATTAFVNAAIAKEGYGNIGAYAASISILTSDLTHRQTYYEYQGVASSDFYLPLASENLNKVITVITHDQSVKMHGNIQKGVVLTELDVTVSTSFMATNNNGSPIWVVINHVEP